MASNHCILIPKAPNGKPSKLFLALKNATNDREMAKRIWGFTQTPLFKSEFSDIETDENGEPTLDAVSKILQLDKILNKTEQDRATAIKDGLMDSSGKPSSFALASTALSKADAFNQKATEMVAIVEEGENGFETSIRDRTPIAIAKADRNKQRAELNEALIRLLNRAGFDIGFVDDPSYQSVFNPLFADQNAEILKQVIRVANGEEGYESIPEEVSHLVLAGLQGHPLKTRIDALFTPAVVEGVLGEMYDSYKKKYRKGKTPLEERLRDEAEGKVLAAILKGENPNETTQITAAPFFRMQLTSENRNKLMEMTADVRKRAQRYASLLGLKISSVENMGGTYLGSAEISYRYNVNSQDKIKVDLLASLLGDLGYEYQDAVISANYVENKDESNAIEVVFKTPKSTRIEDITELLGNLGIDGSSYSFDNNELSIIIFDEGDLDTIIEKFKDTDYEFKEANLQDSRYLDNESRRNLYETWLNSEVGSQKGELHNAVSKALAVCEAAARFGRDDQESERLDAANAAARQWDVDHQESETQLPAPVGSKNLFKRLYGQANDNFRKISEDDVDAAITNAENALKPVADLMRSGEIERLLDKDQIMAHEKMYDLSSQTEKMLEITQEGEVMLSKKLHILQNTTTEEDTKKLRKTITSVRNDLENQRYALACYRIIDNIGKDIKGLMTEADSLHFVFNNTTNLNLISSEAGLVNRMATAVEAYTPYLETLATLPDLVQKGQIAMDKSWADRVSSTANEYLGHIRTLQKDIRSMRFSVLKQLVMLYYGNMGEKPEGFKETDKVKWESVDMILNQANEDISWWDTNLFSAGDSKNPLINVIHNIVVSQQAKRNNKINKLCAKMQEADAKLKKAGYDNKFIYQYDTEGKPTGYYVAPIDMARYERERKEFIESLEEDLDFYERQRKINDWENKHLEEVEVGKPAQDGTKRTESMPKRSIYAVPNFQEGWSQAQKDYYNSILEMKAEMDSYLPAAMQSLYTAPQVRKSVTQMFDKDGRGAIKTMFGQWKQRFTIVDDNTDYGKNTVFGFDGKPIKQVPIYYVNKLSDRADLSTDGTHAIFNYIAMAVNYAEMGQLANAMRLMQQHVKTDYEVVQTDAGKPIIDKFKALGRKYEREYTETGTGTNVVKAIDTYINRTFFNETKNKMGNWKHPFNDDKTISKDSVFNIFMYLTSVGRMGLNVLSGITNATQGETQMICEAAAGRFFGVKDLAWAKKEYGKLLLNYAGQFNAADRHDKMYMLINQFNSSEDFFRDMMDKDFNKGAYKRVLGRGNIYFLNTMGEHYLHTSGMLMVLHHEKVTRVSDPSKTPVSLYDVIKEVHDENGWHLELDDDIEFVDKNRAFLQTENLREKQIIKKGDRDALFENLALYINKINADMHGGYSEAEKGNINQKALGRAILQFRQWMFGMYNKLYAGSYYDAVNKVMREGGYRSISKFITGTIHDWKNMSLKLAIENNQLTYEERQNARVALAQSALFIILCVMCKATAGWKDDDDRNTRLLAYSMKRLKMETGALVPWPPSFIENVFTLIQSPAAGVNTLQNVMGIFDLNNLFDEVGAGRYKGWNKALKAIWTSTPLYNIQKLIDMKDYNYMFNIFK